MGPILAAALIRFVTIGSDALPEARDVGAQVVTQHDGVAVVEVDDSELEALSQEMHLDHDRCGGFMVHDTLEEALAPATKDGRKPIDYTLDRQDLVRQLLFHVDQDKILDTIAQLSSMQNRYYQSKSGAEASLWLQDRWQKLAAGRSDVSFELFDQGYPQKSVIMTIRGTTRPDEVIVIGGHLDSIALGGKAANAPGADDDASGIATLTEVARVLLQSNYRPERTIKFMAYAAEEVGLRGSLAIAKDFQKRKVNVVGALQLDMTNYQGSDKDIWLMKDFTSAPQNAFVVKLIETYVGASYGFDACGYACSDHASWDRIGVPASMPFESRMNERNKQIHTKRDTLELSRNNAQHATKFARLGVAYAVELAKGSDGRPHSESQLVLPDRSDDSDDLPALLAVLFLVGAAAMARRIV